jgi:hypothetical protein
MKDRGKIENEGKKVGELRRKTEARKWEHERNKQKQEQIKERK